MKIEFNELKKKLKEILVQNLNLEIEPEDIEDEEILFGNQLDSVSTMLLVDSIETEFDIEIDDEELTSDTLESIQTISMMVIKKIDYNG